MQDIIRNLTEDQLLQHAYQFHQQGQLQEANILYCEILKRNSNNHQALHLKGVLESQTGKIDHAINLIKKALTLCESHIYYNNLANIFNSRGATNEIADCLRKSLACEPVQPDVQKNLILLVDKIDNETLKSEIYMELGSSLFKSGQYKEALIQIKLALKYIPGNANAYCNIGLCYTALGENEQALKNYDKALKIQPNHIDVNQNRGQLLLKLGDFKKGALGYRYRLKRPAYVRTRLTQIPEWNGENLKDKHILIIAEQGIGDEVMFSAIIPILLGLAASVTLEVDQRLKKAMQRTYPSLRLMDREENAHNRILPDNLNYYSVAGEAFYRLHSSIRDYGKYRPNLLACPDKVKYFTEKYKNNMGSKKRIGIAWRSKSIINPAERSITLDQLLPLLQSPECVYINLQYGDIQDELNQFRQKHNIDIYNDPEVNPINDIESFLAQIETLDSVISIDNSTVHFSGVLQKETHMLLPTTSDHRWLINRKDSPIYPSITIYRQENLNDWESAVESLKASVF